MPALAELYDEIWVYGLPQICDPLEGIDVPPSVRDKMVYTGYLRRDVAANGAAAADLTRLPLRRRSLPPGHRRRRRRRRGDHRLGAARLRDDAETCPIRR